LVLWGSSVCPLKTYQAIGGLIAKSYTIEVEERRIGGVYLWELQVLIVYSLPDSFGKNKEKDWEVLYSVSKNLAKFPCGGYVRQFVKSKNGFWG